MTWIHIGDTIETILSDPVVTAHIDARAARDDVALCRHDIIDLLRIIARGDHDALHSRSVHERCVAMIERLSRHP